MCENILNYLFFLLTVKITLLMSEFMNKYYVQIII